MIVYSSETQLWGVAREFGFDLETVDFNEGILFNGALYWPLRPDGEVKYMHRYDIESEVHLEESLLPPKSPEWKYQSWHYFGRSRDHPYIIEECLSWDISSGCTYSIYDIQPDFSFSRNSRIASPENPASLASSRFGWFRPLCFQTEGDKEVLFYGLGNYIFSLDMNIDTQCLRVGSFSDLAETSSSNEGNTHPVMWGWGVIPYTNTLCPLK